MRTRDPAIVERAKHLHKRVKRDAFLEEAVQRRKSKNRKKNKAARASRKRNR